MGGKPFVPPLGPEEGAPGYWTVSADPTEHTRLGLYILQRRNYRFPMFDVFDLPVNAVSAPARDVTTVAPQALWMLNNPTAIRQSKAFASQLKDESKAGWNIPDFGPGQSGWLGNKSGVHAGWALREDNGNPTESIDDPVGRGQWFFASDLSRYCLANGRDSDFEFGSCWSPRTTAFHARYIESME
jgi:hypothetical protein